MRDNAQHWNDLIGNLTDVFSSVGRSDRGARKGHTVILKRETTVNAKVKTDFCWKTVLGCGLARKDFHQTDINVDSLPPDLLTPKNSKFFEGL